MSLGKKILLVGGCGFIGHNLALKLKKKGHQVFIADSLSVNNILSFIVVNGKASDSVGADSDATELQDININNIKYFRLLSIN